MRLTRKPRCRVCKRTGVRLYPFPFRDGGRLRVSARCYDCLDVESRHGPA